MNWNDELWNDELFSKKTLEEQNKLLKERREATKQYTEEQMRKDIKKYGLDKEFGIYIVDEVDESELWYPGREYSGYLIKKKDGKFQVVITGDRAIPTEKMEHDTINEAMACLVLGLRCEKSKEEYYRAKYFRNGR